MKASFERINFEGKNSFLIKSFEMPAFDAPFHFHPEMELTYIKKGEGQRYVGAGVSDFEEEDMVLLGSNLPHCWISKTLSKGQMVEATVIQFKEDFLGRQFLASPELNKIRHLFFEARVGLKIKNNTQKLILEEMHNFNQSDSFQQLLIILKILGILADSADLEPIDSNFSKMSSLGNDAFRYQKIMAYLIEHYKEDISLQKIAEVANLSPSSFCRYFKNLTGKTFLEIINTYRIQYACQLLLKKDLSISQIAFESGFNDVPYFNKLFKKLKGVSPGKFYELKSNGDV